MKTKRRFRGSWYLGATVAAIVLCELVRAQVVGACDVRANPVVVAFLAAGLVGAIASVLFDGADVD